MPGTLVIRADASTEIGAGHVMRCLALAQAWQDEGGETVFVSTEHVSALEERIRSEGFDTVRLECDQGSAEDAERTAELARERSVAWVVVDGYNFGADYQKAFKGASCRVLVIDDNGEAGEYVADIVLNQNLHATEAMYEKRGPHTRLLLGTKYVLLRREFLAYRGWKHEIPDVARKVLVTMGGGDPDNVTTNVVRALDLVEVDGLEAVVVVGGGNRHLQEIRAAAGDSRHSVRVERNVANMPDLMAWADMAVSAGGTTVWELAAMGVPAVVGVIAPIEEWLVAGLDKRSLFCRVGRFDRLSPSRLAGVLRDYANDNAMRSQMASLGREVVDGGGGRRVAAAVRA